MEQSTMQREANHHSASHYGALVSETHNNNVSGYRKSSLYGRSYRFGPDVAVEVEKKLIVAEIFSMISEKEQQVLTMKANSYTYAEIAKEAHVSYRSAKRIMKNIRTRMAALYPDLAAAYGHGVRCFS